MGATDTLPGAAPPELRSGGRKVQLQELSHKHRQVAALLAQGVDRGTIATICDFTPEYVTWLGGDPLFRQYLKEMSQISEARLEALFDRAVETIADGMLAGTVDERLKAARLQLEATRRIGPRALGDQGSGEGTLERLERLAERLTSLNRARRDSVTIDQED